MLNKISKQFAEVLVQKTQSGNEKEEIYVYGLELILSTCAGFFSILMLSALLKEVLSGIVFICFFAPLRMFVGGYHADTYRKCFLISNISYLIVLGMKEMIWKRISVTSLFVLLVIAVVYILGKAPIISDNQYISKDKQLRSKKIAKIILCIQVLANSCLVNIYRELMCMAVLSVCLVALFMLITDEQVTVKKKKGEFGI